MIITSLTNERIKEYTKLQDKKYRDTTNKFLIEGAQFWEVCYNEEKNKIVYTVINIPQFDKSMSNFNLLARNVIFEVNRAIVSRQQVLSILCELL